MICDPAYPGYRYPEAGERLWHGPWRRWCVVIGQPDYGPIDDEVEVRFDDGQQGSVKLRSLEEEGPR